MLSILNKKFSYFCHLWLEFIYRMKSFSSYFFIFMFYVCLIKIMSGLACAEASAIIVDEVTNGCC